MSFIISAPASGSGKTTITLGLLRAISRIQPVRAAKSGPDYIDPRFHTAACGADCVNLDAWAMASERIKALVAGPHTLIVEGAMGLFDGAPPQGKGATADLARMLNLPVVLVVDAARMAGSVAPLVKGFATHDPTVHVAGVILNNVGSIRHERMLRTALDSVRIFGAVPRRPQLSLPSRHLGLVQAREQADLQGFLDQAADLMEEHLDLPGLIALHTDPIPASTAKPLPPPAQRIAVAQDDAFAFSYPHMIRDWHKAGAEITSFSPLADMAVPHADFVFLPGGYPELYAGRLAANQCFLDSLHHSTATIYGECGGYMTLGETLTDADGIPHKMAGLLPLETSFADRKLHLGYRRLTAKTGPLKGGWMGHEFHYATTLRAQGQPLFYAADAEGAPLAPMGLIQNKVFGSFAHIIDQA